MYTTIKELLIRECKKHISRHHKRVSISHSNQSKFKKRTGLRAKKKKYLVPPHWALDKHFNPFLVLANVDCIAFTIAKKIHDKSYIPKPCLINSIPKPGGGERKVSLFTIPDAVVSKYLYTTLLKRNFAAFSSYAYAYRTDRNAHNAIEHLYDSVNTIPRSYILEYDFSKYFDTIEHSYLLSILKSKLKISQRELYLIEQLIKYSKAEGIESYSKKIFSENQVGIPQGSTISLLLANMACAELDKKIEGAGGLFARFSDDSVIICNNYDKAHRCANHMISHGLKSGTKINFNKSDGISLLTEDRKSEIRSKEYFDFLGHSISSKQITLREKTIKNIKTRISQIINRHLIHYPQKHTIAKSRYSKSTKTDWDLVTCIHELRKYIYGRVTENKLSKCLSDKKEPLEFTLSVMSFYPLVTDEKIFKSLDGWLIDTLDKALKVRESLVKAKIKSYTRPSKKKLLEDTWYKSAFVQETKIPSFVKSWLYTKKLVKVYGIQKFPTPEYY
ncbi:MAG: hypothetical protein J0L56_07215 [Chitinophagales bacterium]|nr:hypothetical protein [Chitinophagales bacterium]